MYRMIKPILVSELSNIFKLELCGEDILIDNIVPVGSTNESSLSFFSGTYCDYDLKGCVISNEILSTTVLQSKNPRLKFYQAIEYLILGGYLEIDKSAPVIGSNTLVEKGAIIEEGVSIGQGCHIGANSVIRSGTFIGDFCIIKPGAIIGNDGFGFVRDEIGVPVRFPHIGGVRIGDHVEIGSNSCIDKGAIVFTKIEDFVKIDNLVHIAHNCQIGKGSMIIAGAEVSGSVTLGEDVWVGPNACIIDGVSIGSNSMVGIGAVVTKSFGNNVTVAGNPARKLK